MNSPRETVQDFTGNNNAQNYNTLLDSKRLQSDLSDHYRRNAPFNHILRQNVYSSFVIPTQVPPQWPGIRHGPRGPLSTPTGHRWNSPPQLPPAAIIASRNARLSRNEKVAVRTVAERLDAAGSTLNFVRLVGWGGQSLVAIFDARIGIGVDADTQYFVAKALHTANNPAGPGGAAGRAFYREKRFLSNWYPRAAHVVQVARLNRPSRRVLRSNRHRLPATTNTAPDVLVLEYLPRGDLFNFLHAVGHDPRDRTPEPVLWHIFGCLARGLIGLQYPPYLQSRFDKRMRNGADGPPISETVPRSAQAAVTDITTDLVHFDLDPQNVLFGDFDCGDHGDRHKITPVLKISDLGLSRSFEDDPDPLLDPRWMNTSSRHIGKLGHWAPEQFTEEWDWVDLLPNPAVHRIAGNYGMHTNVFQIGLVCRTARTARRQADSCWQIMYSAITQCETSESGVPHPEVFRNGWTYGGYLDDPRFVTVSQELRDLVKQCLCDDPSHRPALDVLSRTIRTRITRGWQRRCFASDTLRQWVESKFTDPPRLIGRHLNDLMDWMQHMIRAQDLPGPDFWG
ncbi:kinase-like domain-containing protein [Immersiella caudata]|uniref:Kinase-like domain-containing protein n=1 Tax=Immersiella caudata TaxID=314043 RepID=A0AA39WK24_9PEZI|nr:kinase-like domain-containing protein [Immersiella caudata]